MEPRCHGGAEPQAAGALAADAGAFSNRVSVANLLGISRPTKSSGPRHGPAAGFGRRANSIFRCRWPKVAQKIGGSIKLIWSREEDMQHDGIVLRRDKLAAGVDEDGIRSLGGFRHVALRRLREWSQLALGRLPAAHSTLPALQGSLWRTAPAYALAASSSPGHALTRSLPGDGLASPWSSQQTVVRARIFLD